MPITSTTSNIRVTKLSGGSGGFHHSHYISGVIRGADMKNTSYIARTFGLAILTSTALMLSGFTIVSSEELIEIKTGGTSPSIDASSLLYDDIIPWASSSARDIGEVLSAIENQGFETTCEEYGVQKGQAFPCTFWIQTSGVIDNIDTSSRVGKITLSDTGSESEVVILSGPVIPGTALRDGYPDIIYNDFSNQDAFASFSDDLNNEVISIIENFGEVTPGDRISIVGAYATWSGMDSAIQVVPVSLERVGGE